MKYEEVLTILLIGNYGMILECTPVRVSVTGVRNSETGFSCVGSDRGWLAFDGRSTQNNGNDRFSMSLRELNVDLFLKWAKIVFEFLNTNAIHDRLAKRRGKMVGA
jgi:hypothetical protein